MIKEDKILVKKAWGYELWFVNRLEYCGKLLFIDRGARCSNHCHKIKTETFFCPEGQVMLTIGNKQYGLNSQTRAKTIFPGEYHTFWAEVKSVLIEVSTHHDDLDSYRLDESQSGKGKGKWVL